jgi:hypothetical protein
MQLERALITGHRFRILLQCALRHSEIAQLVRLSEQMADFPLNDQGRFERGDR